MKKIIVCFGTRPEAIKMCPLIKELQARKKAQVIIVVTGQHQEMLSQVLDIFEVKPNYNLKIMKAKQSLFDVTINILSRIKSVFIKEKPDLVLVHGDTASTFAAALAAFYLQIPVGHVEAGLRSYNLYSPFPEEFNRLATGIIAQYHFAPTKIAAENLQKEGKKNIFITGNTVIDALKTTVKKNYYHPLFTWLGEDKLILLTAHRRENIGTPLENIFRAVKKIVSEFPNLKIIYPIHLNLEIKTLAEILLPEERIKIIEPLNVIDFHNFIARSYLILTDSGGIQEEAPSLGKPVLVMRDTTERPEGIIAGTLKLVGTNENTIYQECKNLLINNQEYQKMSKAINPYGDGLASKRICDILEKVFL